MSFDVFAGEGKGFDRLCILINKYYLEHEFFSALSAFSPEQPRFLPQELPREWP